MNYIFYFLWFAVILSCSTKQNGQNSDQITLGDYYLLSPPADTNYSFVPQDSLSVDEKQALSIWSEKDGTLLLFKLIEDGIELQIYSHHYNYYSYENNLRLIKTKKVRLENGRYSIAVDSMEENYLEEHKDEIAYFKVKDDTLLYAYNIYDTFLKLRFNKIDFLKQTYLKNIAERIEAHRNHIIAWRSKLGLYKLYWKEEGLYLKNIYFHDAISDEEVYTVPHSKGIEIKYKDPKAAEEMAFMRIVVDTSITQVRYSMHGDWFDGVVVPDPDCRLKECLDH